MSARRRRPNTAAPAQASASERWPLRLLQQAVVLLLAVLGFLFCLLSSYQLDLPVSTLVLTALAFSLLALGVFSFRRYGILALVCLLAAGAWVWVHASELQQGFLLLIEQAITPLSLRLPESLGQLLQPVGEDYALRLMTQALQLALFLVSFAAGYFTVCHASVPGLALSTLPLLLPAPFYLLAPGVVPFFALLTAHLMVFAFNNGRRAPTTLRAGAYVPQTRRKAELSARRTAQQTLSLLALPLIALAALLSSVTLPQEGYTRPEAIEALQQKLFSLDIGKESFWKSNDGLTRGNLNNLTSIRFSGNTAIQVRVSERLSLYLRDFAGTRYSSDGWSSVSAEEFSALENSVSGIAPQNLLAAAATVSGTSVSTFALSVRNVEATPLSIWTPPALVTQAGEIANAGYVQDTALAFASSAGSSEYSLEAVPVGSALYSVSHVDGTADSLESAYLDTAGSAYGLSRAGGSDADRVRDAASAYIGYIFDQYTALPDDTRAAAERLCETYGLTREVDDGTLNLAATCQTVRALLSARCSYAYSPEQVPEGADFTTYFLEESRSGYCVHFATSATVLLRALGIPARYAEGYIVIQTDYDKQPDAEGYIDIEDTHAHAWVEVFDPAQLEWIPVEMTSSTESSPNASPSPDDEGDEPGTTQTLTTSTPEPTPEPTPTPTPTPEPTPEEQPPEEQTDDTETAASTPDAAAGESDEAQITPTPAPGEQGGEEEGGLPSPEPDDAGQAVQTVGERPPLWPVFALVFAAGVPLFAFGWRKMAHEKRLKSFMQKDLSAAALAICRYALHLLHFAGANPMDPAQSAEEYAAAVSKQLPWVDRGWLESVLLIAQRARFSGRMSTRAERDEALAFARVLTGTLPGRLPRLKRWLFRWRFPAV
ncbi:MAG: transglutaminase domain-containing protein [Clostridiales bacterium]|nr:transglutaminase domain-containing protein [Clostridiales bacterium]